MSSSLYKCQKAIIDKLESSSLLKSKVTGIFGDDVPEKQPFPLIQISNATETPNNTFDKLGKDTTFTIHIWSQYDGFKECYEILTVIEDLLDYQELSVNNYQTIFIRFENANALRGEDDRNLRQIAVRFNLVLLEN